MSSIRTHYDNLQIARTASDAVVRAAYRGLSQQHHPDKNPNDRTNAERRMKVINEAYVVLSDPEKRREHDQWIVQMEADTRTSQPDISPSAAATQVAYDFVVYPSKKKMAWMFLGSIIFVAIGVGMFMENKKESSWLHEAMRSVAIYLGVPLFGVCGVFYWTVLLSPTPPPA